MLYSLVIPEVTQVRLKFNHTLVRIFIYIRGSEALRTQAAIDACLKNKGHERMQNLISFSAATLEAAEISRVSSMLL